MIRESRRANGARPTCGRRHTVGLQVCFMARRDAVCTTRLCEHECGNPCKMGRSDGFIPRHRPPLVLEGNVCGWWEVTLIQPLTREGMRHLNIRYGVVGSTMSLALLVGVMDGMGVSRPVSKREWKFPEATGRRLPLPSHVPQNVDLVPTRPG